MRLISLWEPWATLMAIGAKRIETRSWRTRYRGLLAIHASKCGLKQADYLKLMGDPVFASAIREYPGVQFAPGHIVAVVDLIEVCPTEDLICLPNVFWEFPELDNPNERAFGNYDGGRWAWVTDSRFRLTRPIPYKAKQGMNLLDDAMIAQIREQSSESAKVRP